jgi:hypothetical protein
MLAAVSHCDFELVGQIEQDLKSNLIRNPDIQRDLSNISQRIEQMIQFAPFMGMSSEQLAGEFASLSASMYARANDPRLNDRDNAAEIRNLRRAAKVYEHAATRLS